MRDGEKGAASGTATPAIRFSGTLTDILDRVEYRRVNSEDQFDPVYRLRYEAYRREEFIPINSQEVVRDEFDDLPNAFCYGIYIDGELVSSLRFHLLNREYRDSPSKSVFPDVLDPILDRGESCIDPGRFTTDYEASLAYPALPFLTLRIVVMAAAHYEVKYCLSSVRPEHSAFYRRIFNSKKLSDERFYHGLSFPMELWASDVPVEYPRLLRRYPFFMSTEEERRAMFGPIGAAGPIVRPTAREAQQAGDLSEIA